MSMTIGVTGTGSLIGQAIIKCIKASEKYKDATLVGFDYFEKTVGSFWCDTNFLLPDILKNVSEKEFLNFVEDKIKLHQMKFLFLGVDFEMPIFAKHKDEMEQRTGCKILVCSSDVVKVANSKYDTFDFLKKNNFSYPSTYRINEVPNNLSDFPMIMKPDVGARSRNVYKVKSLDEAKEKSKGDSSYILQELIGNDEVEYTCGTVYFKDLDDFPILPLKRSLKEGNTFIAEYNPNDPNLPVIYDYIKKLVPVLNPYGSCNFQLRIDSKGQPKLFEINSRHSGTTFMRCKFGFNEVEFILDYFLENKKSIKLNLKRGKVVRYYDEFFIEN